MKTAKDNNVEHLQNTIKKKTRTSLLGWGASLAIFIFFMLRPVGDAEKGSLIAGLSVSIMLNVLVLAVIFVLPLGRKVLQRFRQRLLYGSGKYTNTLYIDKNGNMKEMFRKVDLESGFFKIQKRNTSETHDY